MTLHDAWQLGAIAIGIAYLMLGIVAKREGCSLKNWLILSIVVIPLLALLIMPPILYIQGKTTDGRAELKAYEEAQLQDRINYIKDNPCPLGF